MFDLVRDNKKLTQGFLVLITLPFALWGVDSYVRNSGGPGDVAKVGSSQITANEFAQAMRDQQERMRGALGPSFNPAMLDNPQAKSMVLENLVSQRLLLEQAHDLHLAVPDTVLREVIAKIPAFQENGQFSPKRYEELLKGQGMNQAGFEARLRQDLLLQQLVTAVGESAFASETSAKRWLLIQQEERDVSDFTLPGKEFEGKVKLADGAVKAFYDANAKRFERPEMAKVEYVVLTADALRDQFKATEEEAKAWYADHKDRYASAEERRASHILITVDKAAPAAEQEKAKAKAQEILAKLKAQPKEFANLAKEYSQDPGSAAKGGDLGFFGRGLMVKPFEDAAFSLKDGETSELVQSDFGWHIIRVTGIKGGDVRSFDSVRGEIVAELSRDKAQKKYAELAEAFTNTVYEQADSLKPAAEKFKLTVQKTDWIARQGAAQGVFMNEKLRNAVFAEDAVKNQRNTEAVDVGNNTLVAAHVLEHKPATVQPLDEVKGAIEQQLVREEAVKLAIAEGEARVGKLQQGEKADAQWSAGRKLTRAAAANIPPEVAKAIFSVSTDKLPAYSGANIPGMGYVMFRVNAVNRPAEVKPEALKAARQQFAQQLAEEDFRSYLNALRTRYKVSINKAALESKNPQ